MLLRLIHFVSVRLHRLSDHIHYVLDILDFLFAPLGIQDVDKERIETIEVLPEVDKVLSLALHDQSVFLEKGVPVSQGLVAHLQVGALLLDVLVVGDELFHLGICLCHLVVGVLQVTESLSRVGVLPEHHHELVFPLCLGQTVVTLANVLFHRLEHLPVLFLQSVQLLLLSLRFMLSRLELSLLLL